MAEDGLAMAMAHAVVIEHGGYISAQQTRAGYRFEMLLPRAEEPPFSEIAPGLGKAPALLMVDSRVRMRVELHNFFEAEGYNLIEAANAQEALMLGELHEGSLGLLVADGADADRIGAALSKKHPALQVLRILDWVGTQLDTASNEILRPFTQNALLEKVAQLIGKGSAPSGSRTYVV
jgi:hypothetical protein